MSISDSIFQHLTEHSEVSSLIGTRLYPSHAPAEAVRPYCVYQWRDRMKPQRVMGVQSSTLIVTIHSEKGRLGDQYETAESIDRAIQIAMAQPITSNETHCFLGSEFAGSTDAYSTSQAAHQHSIVAGYLLTTQSIQ